jgi:ribonuclease HI
VARPKVTIYTDGGAEPNPGPGGWGAVLLFEQNGQIEKKELRGGDRQTTNNRMEITAALQALRSLPESYDVLIYTDSTYLRSGITEWMAGWKQTNFKNGKIQNVDLWELLDSEVARHTIRWQWVKGHANNPHNERADVLATLGRAEARGEKAVEALVEARYRAILAVAATPAFGAWVVSFEAEKQPSILSGREAKGVANRLGLTGVIAALEATPAGETLHFSSNSNYLTDGIKGWLRNWKQNGWRTKEGSPVKNRDLWEKVDHLLTTRRIKVSAITDDDPAFAAVKQMATEKIKQG